MFMPLSAACVLHGGQWHFYAASTLFHAEVANYIPIVYNEYALRIKMYLQKYMKEELHERRINKASTQHENEP